MGHFKTVKGYVFRQVLILVLFFCSLNSSKAAIYYSRATGNFSAVATWSTVACGGAAAITTPGALDDIIICAGNVVSVTANAPIKNIAVQTGGTLQTGTAGGGANKTLTVSGTFTIQSGGLYIHNNNQLAPITIFAGTEVFNVGSTVRIDSWSGTADFLVTGLASNFGNLILSWNPGMFYWNNQGLGFTRIITGNFTVQNGCATYLDALAGNTIFTIGGNLVINDGFLLFKQGAAGDITINVTGTIFCSGTSLTTSYLYGIYQANGKFVLNANAMEISNGSTFGIYNGDGTGQFNITSSIVQSGGDFRGVYNLATFTAGVTSFQVGSFNFTGGTFNANYAHNPSAQTVNFIVTGDLSINYSAATNLFAISRLATLSGIPSTHVLNMTVGGKMTIGGTAAGEFDSNNSTGIETVVITGNLSVSNGNNYFNVVPALGGNGHNSTLTVNGNLLVNGGNTYLSSETGNLVFNLAGSATISGGTLSAKGQSGTGTLNFNGTFTQSAGTFLLFNNAAVAAATPVTATVLGNFSQTGGIINFSNNAAATAVNNLILKGATYTISGNGSMTRAGAGVAATFGMLYFQRAGTISFSRTAPHSIQQVKQEISPACTVDVILGDVQIASHALPALNYFNVSGNAVLDLRSSQVFSNALAANSGITVSDLGRLRTKHASGLYNNSTLAAFNSTGTLNYFLGANSIVEYYGTATQIMTGINLGLATANQHKYGIVEVNQVTPLIWVTPTNLPSATGNIFVRTELRLTSGELNLANNAGNPLTGGRTVTVENSNISGITRTTGYIRSEVRDFSGAIIWTMNSTTGGHAIPFGYSSANYIPVTYDLTSGNAGNISFATYNTPSTNLPWPPAVTNLNSLIGLAPDNRDATSDRFWLVSATSTPTAANLILSYQASELPIIPYNVPAQMRAQHYDLSVNKWQPSLVGQSAIAYAVTIPNITSQRVWTLSNSAAPLPVTWVMFNLEEEAYHAKLYWSTASEQFNDFFTVERSTDLLSVEAIGKVAGSFFSQDLNEYSFTDKNPIKGISWYRIRQTDLNGESSTTQWEQARFSTKNDVVNIYPNPANNFLYVATDVKEVSVRIIDASGRLVWNKSFMGRNERYQIDVSGFEKGIYEVMVLDEEKIKSSKVMIE